MAWLIHLLVSAILKIDQIVSAPNKQGYGRRWWVVIKDISDCRRFVKVKGGKMSGRAWWVKATDLMTRTQHRAR